MWQLQILGGISLRRLAPKCSPLTRFRTRKTAALLAYLALHRGAQPREVISCELWPEANEESARNNLRAALSSLRRELEPPGIPEGSILKATRHHIELCEHALICDALLFQTKYQEARKGENPKLAALAECFMLYGGRLLHGHSEEWSEPLSLHLETLFTRVTLDLCREHEANDDLAEALNVLAKATLLAPQRDDFEIAARQMRARPLQTTTPYPHTQKTHVSPVQLNSSGFVTEESRKHSNELPLYPTSFEGRQSELEWLNNFWRRCGDCRFVSLVGPPGMGKTRIAVEAARALGLRHNECPCRIYFVGLSPIESASAFIEALRLALHLPANSGGDPLEIIAQSLQNEEKKDIQLRTLLLLDNLEHLLPDVLPLIQRLRVRVPSLQIWATSRSPLGLPGEELLPVENLPLPGCDETPISLLQNASVALFYHRARSARAGFALTAANSTSIARLCHQLEGWPFALELAAARSHSFTPEQMEEELRQSHDFLRRHTRRSDADTLRHSSLQAAIRWSYNLLDCETARFFRALCVFRGGVTLDMARRTTGEERCLSFLTKLVSHSLVTCDEQGGELRYGLLEGVRQFLRSELSEAQWKYWRECQARAFVQWLEESQTWRGEQAPRWLERLDAERENGRAAQEWARENDSTLLARLGAELWRYFDARALIGEGQQCLKGALENAASIPLRDRLALENGLSRLCFRGGDFAAGLEWCQHAVSTARHCHDEMGEATARLHEGILLLYLGQIPAAAESLERALMLFERVGQGAQSPTMEARRHEAWGGEAQTLAYLGVKNLLGNALDEAFLTYQKAIAKAEQAGDWNVLALSYFLCGEVLGPAGGRYEEARPFFGQSLQTARRVRDTSVEIYALWGLCRVALWEKDIEQTRNLLGQIDEIVRQAGLVWCAVFIVEIGAFLASHLGDWRRVALLLGAAEAAREAMQFPLIAAYYIEFEEQFAPLWEQVEPEQLTSLWAKGRSLSVEQALDIVRGADISRLNISSPSTSDAPKSLEMPFPMGFPLEKSKALPLLAGAYEGSGRLASLQGDLLMTRQFLRQAAGLYSHLGMTAESSRVHLLLQKF